MTKIILASASPRRRELIQRLKLPYTIEPAMVDEESVTHPDPAINVMETAKLKAIAVAGQLAANRDDDNMRLIIVAADTTVALDGAMLGKPVDEAVAWNMLRALRGRVHYVYTGIVVIDPGSGQMIMDKIGTAVRMRHYSDDEIAAYIATGDPMDKAGSYAIQHPEFQPVDNLSGCYTNVVGLPLCRLGMALQSVGVVTPVDVVAACRQSHHLIPGAFAG